MGGDDGVTSGGVEDMEEGWHGRRYGGRDSAGGLSTGGELRALANGLLARYQRTPSGFSISDWRGGFAKALT